MKMHDLLTSESIAAFEVTKTLLAGDAARLFSIYDHERATHLAKYAGRRRRKMTRRSPTCCGRSRRPQHPCRWSGYLMASEFAEKEVTKTAIV